MTTPPISPIETRLRAMLAQQYVAIIRVNSGERAVKAAEALARAGFKMIEVTMTVPGALDIIKDLAARNTDGVMIGAGTVMSAPDARQCIENGAQFIVSPICEPDIIRPCRDAGVVVIPAGLTPTEIVHAWRMGAHLVKVYPAGSVGGPAYIRALRGPLPDIPLWVSGMLTAREACEYLKAGVQLVGLGQELLPAGLMDANEWDTLSQHARRLLVQARGEVEV
jgi:2-dehydro-3-deoxyphosphogluconate aldolase/(4S)-4-hydroxy-2-oxoglutarate aldolase